MSRSEEIITGILGAWASGRVPTSRDRAVIAACALYRFPLDRPNWVGVGSAAGVPAALAQRYAVVGSAILLREGRRAVEWAQQQQRQREVDRARVREGLLRESAKIPVFLSTHMEMDRHGFRHLGRPA